MIVHTMEQRSPEWYAIRKGRMTASEAQCISANGKGLETYVYKIVVSSITGREPDAFNGNRHTERGNELEPDARLSYELIRDVTIEQVGFVEEDEFVGCSPDGLVGTDGGVEIKCPDDVKFFKLLIGAEKPDEEYIWQCQMILLVTGREWIDLCFYNPNFTKSMIIVRIVKELWRQEKLILGIARGKKLIQELQEKYASWAKTL